MLTRFTVDNYKCLKNVSVELQPLHVLIGQNDAGKTSLLEAMLAFFASTRVQVNDIFPRPWQGGELVFSGSRDRTVFLAGELSRGAEESLPKPLQYDLKVEFPSEGDQSRLVRERLGGSAIPHEPVITSVRLLCTNTAEYVKQRLKLDDQRVSQLEMVSQLLSSAHMYRLDPKLMALPAAFSDQRKFRMDADGFGLPTLLDDILGYDAESFVALKRAFCGYFPQYSNVRVETEQAHQRKEHQGVASFEGRQAIGKAVYLDTASEATIRARQASDGAILFLGFLALSHTPKPPKLLLLEEPENGIYPKRLDEVIGVLKEISGQNSDTFFPQIVMSTHSPYVLSSFEPEQVTFLSRQPDGSVRARSMAEIPDIKERWPGFYLGELWYNLSEEELFGEAKAAVDH